MTTTAIKSLSDRMNPIPTSWISQPRLGTWLAPIAFAALTAIVPLHHDLWRSYITTSDADIIFVFEQTLVNDWLPQWEFDHTGHVYILLLGLWSQILHLLGILNVIGFREITQLSADSAVEAYTHLVVADRVFSILAASAFVTVMFFALRRMTHQPLAATVCAVIFAFGIGITDQSLLLRTEAFSALFVFLAFLALVTAAQSAPGRSDILLAVAGFCSVAAMATKMQAIFALLGLPVLAIAFGKREPLYTGRAEESERSFLTLLLSLTAIAMGAPVAAMIVRAIQFRDNSGLYQALMLGYIVLAMLTYIAVYRVDWRRAINGIAALSIGASLGFYLLFVHYHPDNVLAIVNVVENMAHHSGLQTIDGGTPSMVTIATTILGGFSDVLRIRIAGVALWHDPIRLLEWIVVLGAVAAMWTGQWRLAVQSLSLLGLALVFEAACSLRWFRNDYRIYTDPWVIVAVGLLFAALLDRARLITVQIAAAMVAAFVVSSSLAHTWPDNFVPRQPAENACYQTSLLAPQVAQQFSRYCR